ncbi:membrane protein [Bacteroidia bacterium]|nr:membrane protein [Bacteroidia bacterium]
MLKNISFYKSFLPHILAIIFFVFLTLVYFQPQLDGKTLHQEDISQWQGMAHELFKYNETTKDAQSVWSGSMFSGMPSYHFGVIGYQPNYLSYIQNGLSLGHPESSGPVFAGLLFAYLFLFLLTRNVWLSLLGAVAVAFSSYNIIILQAGHVNKAWAIAYMPLVLSGILLTFRKKFLIGGALFALGLGLELASGHVQITYYLAIFCAILFAGYIVYCLKKKEFQTIGKSLLVLIIGLIFAALPRLSGLYSDYEMTKESLRGPSELTATNAEEAKTSGGLDIDYAFTWSYGRGETLSFLIPDIHGGATGGMLGKDSDLYKELKQHGQRVGKEIQAYTYWGDQPFTSGPVYFGAVICFLFVLGMFVIPNKAKWWWLGATVFFVFLSWGRNFAVLNDFLFYHLPMYNKFRTPSMALVIPGLIFPIIGVWGLRDLYRQGIDKKRLQKQLLYSLGITGIICLIFWWLPGMFFNFQSPNDIQLTAQVPDWYYTALLSDREALLKSDAFRSLIFVLLAAACIYFFFITGKNKKQLSYSFIILAVLVLADLWTVDKRYLNSANFEKKKSEKVFEPTVADNIILEDKTPSYRVLNMTASTFNEATTSYFHKSIGGYHAAKLRRYQELIDHRITKEMQLIGQSFQGATSFEDIYPVFANTPTLNMLNAKYIIFDPKQAPITNPHADGNAWFVQNVQLVENADQEIEALNTIDPLKTAVVDKKFADKITQQSFIPDSTATIELVEYLPPYLKYEFNAATDQLVVFSEIYYRNDWKAFIDGEPADHFRADWVLRAMNVPAGKHTIEFRFEPETFNMLSNIGSVASLVLILLFVGTLIYVFIKEQKKNSR